MNQLTVLCWLWSHPDYRTTFTAEHVNIWASMMERNLTIPHRLLCITDNPKGIDIDTYPLWEDFEDLSYHKWNPEKRPQCYRRVRVFDPSMRTVLGKRFVSIDLDCVVTGSLDEPFSRPDDFIICESQMKRYNDYVGRMWMMDTGCRPMVYRGFDQEAVDRSSMRWAGSDQAWIRECLGPHETTFTQADGVDFFNRNRQELPRENTRIVFFSGRENPFDEHLQEAYPWIRQHYR